MSIILLIFWVSIGMVGIGFFVNIGSDKKNDFIGHVIFAFMVLLTYVFIIIYETNSNVTDILYGGIPVLGDILGFEPVFANKTIIDTVISFFDAILIVAIMQLISFITPSGKGILFKLLAGIVLSGISVLFLFYICQYKWLHITMFLFNVVLCIVAISSFIAVVIGKVREHTNDSIKKLADLSKYKLVLLFRNSFFKGILFSVGFYLLQIQLKDMLMDAAEEALSVLIYVGGMILVGFGPVIIMVLGLVFLFKSVFK